MVAPLTLTDCHIDQQDRRILRLVVRSWDNDVPHMAKLKSSSPGTIIPPLPPSSSSGAVYEVKTVLPTLLRPRLEVSAPERASYNRIVCLTDLFRVHFLDRLVVLSGMSPFFWIPSTARLLL